MRALSKLVTVAMVTVAFVRAGCTSSTVPPTTTTTSSRQTVIHADVAQFGTLARQELRKSFEAIYRFLYQKGVGKGQLQDFRIWSGPEGFFAYEAPLISTDLVTVPLALAGAAVLPRWRSCSTA
jgi:hypothetical protein